MNNPIEIFILIFIILVVIFLISREIVTWYWKINKAISLLEAIEVNTHNHNPNLKPQPEVDGVNDTASTLVTRIRESNSEAQIYFLMKCLKDTNPEVRFEAADALGRIGDKSAISPLKDLLRS